MRFSRRLATYAALPLVALSAAFAAGTASSDPISKGPAATPGEPAEVTAARTKDWAAYESEQAALHRDAEGTWVAIAGGKVVAKGKALDDVKAASREALHRYVFRVGDDGDREEYITTWYAARFAGLAFAKELGLGVQLGSEITVEKDGVSVTAEGKTPFPRLRVKIATPDGKPPAREGPFAPEMFLGTVGPALAVTPDDAAYLHLERWEVPGTLTLGGMPCRRVLVTTSVPGIEGEATFAAAYALAPRERLVDLARWRGKFWQWGGGGPISQMPIEGLPDGEWIVFGNDRVLGHGGTAEEAVTDADLHTESAYHRYLLRLPDLPPPYLPGNGERPKPMVFDVRKFTVPPPQLKLNDRLVDAKVFAAEPPVYLVSATDAASLHLELAESPSDARLIESDDPKAPVRYARVGSAWTYIPVVKEGKRNGVRRGLALVVYERQKEAFDDPLPAFPGFGEPGMR